MSSAESVYPGRFRGNKDICEPIIRGQSLLEGRSIPRLRYSSSICILIGRDHLYAPCIAIRGRSFCGDPGTGRPWKGFVEILVDAVFRYASVSVYCLPLSGVEFMCLSSTHGTRRDLYEFERNVDLISGPRIDEAVRGSRLRGAAREIFGPGIGRGF